MLRWSSYFGGDSYGDVKVYSFSHVNIVTYITVKSMFGNLETDAPSTALLLSVLSGVINLDSVSRIHEIYQVTE